jgi:hypothetical protein
VILRYRRPWLIAAGLLAVVLGLVAPAAAFAAVANDAALTVTFVDAVTLLPVDGAAVHVTAHQDGAVLAEFDATTDASGVAVLAGLPRETAEAGAVTVDVVAHKEKSFTDADTGCVLDDTWDASRLAVPVSDVAVTVAFTLDEQQAVSSIQCPPDQPPPTGEVGGAVGTPAPRPHATLPPTDAVAASSSSSGGLAAVVAGLIGVAAGVLVLAPRPQRASVRVERRRRR